MTTMDWEKIEDREDEITWRTPVVGGWIVHFYQDVKLRAAIFLPDPSHEWDGKSVKVSPATCTEREP